MLSYSVVVILIAFFSFRYFRISFQFRHAGWCVIAAVVLYFAFKMFFTGKGITYSLIGALCMLCSYCLLMLLDPQVKKNTCQGYAKINKTLTFKQRG